jgi:hypothetical protein
MPGGDLLQAGDDPVAQRRRLEDHDVGAVTDQPAGERVGVGEREHHPVAARFGHDLGGPAAHPGRASRLDQNGGPVCALDRAGEARDVADQVEIGRRLVRAGASGPADAADDAAQAEAAGGLAVEIVTDDVPLAAPADHAPRLQAAGRGGVLFRRVVVEADRLPGPHGRGERLERRIDGDHGLDPERGGRIDVDAGRA